MEVDKVEIVDCELGRLHIYYCHENGKTWGMTKLFVRKDKMHFLHAVCPKTITKTRAVLTNTFDETRDMWNHVADMRKEESTSTKAE